MKNFMLLHYGFEKPTAEDMAAWKSWFELIGDIQVERGGFRGGKEITDSGVEDLPFGSNSITGYTIITANDLEEAVVIAQKCPIVDSTCVYEIHKG
ncbi:MAG: hypothetical protein CL666_14830 [Balneola sp.]|nr:hypothetical protein [Balneola sp.]|tara:strand:- start:29686 stop:29973 length:288 start_codon:yes stop_codon:yes gene_type:complete